MSTRIPLLSGLLCFSFAAMADVPQPGLLYRTLLDSGMALNWMLEGSPALGWRLRVSDADRLLVDADLGACAFCADEEDNCAANGVFLREIAGIDTPLAIAVCHVGAHSQRLHLFDPAFSNEAPAMKITGSFYLDWSIDARRRLLIEWDGEENDIPGCDVETDSSLALAPAQNRLALDSACYRTGSTTD
ncbi:MAG: hypothetical protein P8Z31_06755 [Gammaproteobacteria bacterium]